MMGAEDSAQVDTRRRLAEGGGGISRFYCEAGGVSGNEGTIEIVGGGVGGLDTGPAQLGYQPALE